MTRGAARRHEQRGEVTLEFALVAVLLIVMVVAIFEFARLAWYYQAASAASREGARFGIANDSDQYLNCDGIRQAAKAKAPDLALSDDDITITYKLATAPASTAGCGSAPELKDGDRILVTVTQDFDFITALIPGGGFDVAASDERSIYTGVPR